MQKTTIKIVISILVWFSCIHAGSSLTEEERLFGYNPRFSGIPVESAPEHHAGKKIALLVLHGFGAPEGKVYKRYFPGDSRYFSVFFNFKDTLFFENVPNEGLFQWSIRKARGAHAINLGQTFDAEVALYALIKLWELGYDVAIYGHSRGGAGAITLADMLAHHNKYANSWKKLGVTKRVVTRGLFYNNTKLIPDTEKIERIRKAIKKFFIEKPLLNINHIISEKLESTLASSTRYSHSEKQPIEILQDLANQGFDLHFTLAEHDNVVTNQSDEKLQEIAQKAGWRVTKVDEEHNDVKASREAFDAYLQSKT